MADNSLMNYEPMLPKEVSTSAGPPKDEYVPPVISNSTRVEPLSVLNKKDNSPSRAYLNTVPRSTAFSQIKGLSDDFVNPLSSFIQDVNKNIGTFEFTAGFSNKNHSPGSQHYVGNAIDGWVYKTDARGRKVDLYDQSKGAIAPQMQQIAAKHGLVFIDEYANPSKASSGPHFHLAYNPAFVDRQAQIDAREKSKAAIQQRKELMNFSKKEAAVNSIDRPDLFIRFLAQNGNYDPNSHNYSGDRYGIGQLRPDQAKPILSKMNKTYDDFIADPKLQVQVAAKYFSKTLSETGDYAKAIALHHLGDENYAKAQRGKEYPDAIHAINNVLNLKNQALARGSVINGIVPYQPMLTTPVLPPSALTVQDHFTKLDASLNEAKNATSLWNTMGRTKDLLLMRDEEDWGKNSYLNAFNRFLGGVPGMFGASPSKDWLEQANAAANIFAENKDDGWWSRNAKWIGNGLTNVVGGTTESPEASLVGIMGMALFAELLGGIPALSNSGILATKVGAPLTAKFGGQSGKLASTMNWLGNQAKSGLLNDNLRFAVAAGTAGIGYSLDEQFKEGKSLREALPGAISAGLNDSLWSFMLGIATPPALYMGGMTAAHAPRFGMKAMGEIAGGAMNIIDSKIPMASRMFGAVDDTVKAKAIEMLGPEAEVYFANRWTNLPNGVKATMSYMADKWFEKVSKPVQAMFANKAMGVYHDVKALQHSENLAKSVKENSSFLTTTTNDLSDTKNLILNRIQNDAVVLKEAEKKAALNIDSINKVRDNPTFKAQALQADSALERLEQKNLDLEKLRAALKDPATPPDMQKTLPNLINQAEQQVAGLSKELGDLATSHPTIANYISNVRKIPKLMDDITKAQSAEGIVSKDKLEAFAETLEDIQQWQLHVKQHYDDLSHSWDTMEKKPTSAPAVPVSLSGFLTHNIDDAVKSDLVSWGNAFQKRLDNNLLMERSLSEEAVTGYNTIGMMTAFNDSANFAPLIGKIKNAFQEDLGKRITIADDILDKSKASRRRLTKGEKIENLKMVENMEKKVGNVSPNMDPQTIRENVKLSDNPTQDEVEHALRFIQESKGSLVDFAPNKVNPSGWLPDPQTFQVTSDTIAEASLNMLDNTISPSLGKLTDLLNTLQMNGGTLNLDNDFYRMTSTYLKDNPRLQEELFTVLRRFNANPQQTKAEVGSLTKGGKEWLHFMDQANDKLSMKVEEQFLGDMTKLGLSFKTDEEKWAFVNAIEGGRKALADYITENPKMAPALGFYLQMSSLIEQNTLKSCNLKSVMRDDYYRHIFPRFEKFAQRLDPSDYASITTKLGSERQRTYQSLRDAHEDALKAQNFVEEVTGQSWENWMGLPNHEARMSALMHRKGYQLDEPLTFKRKDMQLFDNLNISMNESRDLFTMILLGDPVIDPAKTLRATMRSKLKAESSRVFLDYLSTAMAPDGKPLLREIPTVTAIKTRDVSQVRDLMAQGVDSLKTRVELPLNNTHLDTGAARPGNMGYVNRQRESFVRMSDVPMLKFTTFRNKPSAEYQLHPDAAKMLNDVFSANKWDNSLNTKILNMSRTLDLIMFPFAHMQSIMSNMMLATGWNSGKAVGLFGLGQHIAEKDTGLVLRAVKAGIRPSTISDNIEMAVKELAQVADNNAKLDVHSMTAGVKQKYGLSGKETSTLNTTLNNIFKTASSKAEGTLNFTRHEIESMLYDSISHAQIGAWAMKTSEIWKRDGAKLLAETGDYGSAVRMAERTAAEMINKYAGVMPLTNMTSSFRRGVYALALAPQYTATKIDTVVGALDSFLQYASKKGVEKGILKDGIRSRFDNIMSETARSALRKDAQKFLGMGMVSSFMFVETLSYLMNGTSTFANVEPDKKLHLMIDGPNGQTSLVSPFFGMFRQYQNMVESIIGGSHFNIMRTAANSLNPIFRTAFDFVSGTNSAGEPIAPPNLTSPEGLKALGNYALFNLTGAMQLAPPIAQALPNVPILNKIDAYNGQPIPWTKTPLRDWCLEVLGMSPSEPKPMEQRAAAGIEKHLKYEKYTFDKKIDNYIKEAKQVGLYSEEGGRILDEMVDFALHKGQPVTNASIREYLKAFHPNGNYVLLAPDQLYNKLEKAIDPMPGARSKVPKALLAMLENKISQYDNALTYDMLAKHNNGKLDQRSLRHLANDVYTRRNVDRFTVPVYGIPTVATRLTAPASSGLNLTPILTPQLPMSNIAPTYIPSQTGFRSPYMSPSQYMQPKLPAGLKQYVKESTRYMPDLEESE